MSLQLGMRIGPYEILAPAETGGMGEVYRARDIRLDRVVALKVMPSIAGSAEPSIYDVTQMANASW